jgi:hypothetical protein
MASQKYRTGVFVSYSHKDREWLDRLQIHLKPYLRGEKLVLWDDTKIRPGANWADEINTELAKARVAVLLVSADFLASEYVANVELPQIVSRATNDMTLLWVPINYAAYEATPLRNFQAAFDPSHPLSTLDPPQQEKALAEIASRVAAAAEVNVVANALKIIDEFEPQVNAYVNDVEEPTEPVIHAVRAEQSGDSIKLIDPGGERELITANELESLDSEAKKLIRSYERTMKLLFERWTELKPKRYAEDEEIRKEARQESDKVKGDLCAELGALLAFLESLGKELMDHYNHVRHICSSSGA